MTEPTTMGALEGTIDFMSKAFPNPDEKNRQTQLGVHFEEISEMLATLHGNTTQAAFLLSNAFMAMSKLAKYTKEAEPTIIGIQPTMLVEFIDSVADQLVTVAGSAYVYGMDPVGALHEVNRSNFTKFVDGEPTFHPETRKLLKGPDYEVAQLGAFTTR